MHFLPFRLRVIPRTLHFKQPAGTSRGVYTSRRVWYILITSADPQIRFTGLGECAPLPDLSCDYSADYEERLLAVCREVEHTQNLDVEALRAVPSMLFGLQSAFRSAAGSLRGDYRLLYPSAFTQGQRGIRINGLVWMGNYDEMCRRMEEKLAQGFACIKLKIGAIDFDSELALIRSLRSRFDAQTVELRVDANGAFAPNEAPHVLDQLAMEGTVNVCVVCPGFVADNLETSVEVNMEMRERFLQAAQAAGASRDQVSFTYVPALGSDPGLISALTCAIKDAL